MTYKEAIGCTIITIVGALTTFGIIYVGDMYSCAHVIYDSGIKTKTTSDISDPTKITVHGEKIGPRKIVGTCGKWFKHEINLEEKNGEMVGKKPWFFSCEKAFYPLWKK